jgi:predicted permease
MSLWRRVRFLVGRRRQMEELDEEIRLHVELRERELREQGLPPAQAARAARLQFGNRTRVREDSQDAWGWNWLDGLIGDLRHAVRLLRGRPLFAAVVVLTLALGIGPNVAIFSVMNAIVLRYLPVQQPDRLVYVHTTGTPDRMSNTGSYHLSFSHAVYAQLRQHEAFSDLMAFVPLGVPKTAVRHGSTPEEANASMVSGNFFTGLGVGSVCGRLLTMQDETSHAPVVVLSHAYWSRRFGKSCDVVGQTLDVKGIPFTIIGVAGAAFFGVDRDSATDLWVPLQDRQELNAWGMSREKNFLRTADWWCLMLIGRLAPGVTEKAALAGLQPAFVSAAYAHVGQPKTGEDVPVLSFGTTRGIAGLRENYEEPLRLLFAMVAIVLVIACGNVALLLAARNSTREREFAVRLALGGGRMQLLRQLLAESLLLVGAAAVLGWVLAMVATEALRAWSDLDVSLAPDRRVLLFTLAVSALATLVFGLAPLRSVTRVPMMVGLRTAASTGQQQRAWARRTVVALQVALCLVLLVSGGLLVRTLRNLEKIPLGMRTTGLLVFGVSPQQRVQSHAVTVRFYETLVDRLRALPGVRSVTLMEHRIGSGWSNNTVVRVDGKKPLAEGVASVRWNSVGPDYFRTLETPLLHGREFRDNDGPGAPSVAVVNETFAKRYLAGQDPLGHSIALFNDGDSPRSQIVGVAADSKYTGVREEPVPMAYFSFKQMDHVLTMHLELRTSGDPGTFLPLVQRAVRDLAPDLPLVEPRTQTQQFARNLANDRLFARVAGFFGLLAVILVATGLYGTLAYAVTRRTAEIGVRVALGAQRGDVLWMVLRESLVVYAAGIVVGLPVALATARVLRASLYGVSPGDPVTVALSLAGLLVVALLASLVPAHRAASVHPMVALRTE